MKFPKAGSIPLVTSVLKEKKKKQKKIQDESRSKTRTQAKKQSADIRPMFKTPPVT